MAARLILLTAAALTGAYFLSRNKDESEQVVRDAGPENMTNPPNRWSKADEESDESFPASDPPANY